MYSDFIIIWIRENDVERQSKHVAAFSMVMVKKRRLKYKESRRSRCNSQQHKTRFPNISSNNQDSPSQTPQDRCHYISVLWCHAYRKRKKKSWEMHKVTLSAKKVLSARTKKQQKTHHATLSCIEPIFFQYT